MRTDAAARQRAFRDDRTHSDRSLRRRRLLIDRMDAIMGHAINERIRSTSTLT